MAKLLERFGGANQQSILLQGLSWREVPERINDVRFSNRPFRVKRFQAYPPLQCRCRSRARASLRNRHQGPSIMGFEDKVERSLGRRCRSSAGPSGHTNSPHPSSREGHHCHRLVEFELPPMTFDLSRLSCCCGCLSVQRNSVPSTQMRCMITASRRASASARGAWSSLP